MASGRLDFDDLYFPAKMAKTRPKRAQKWPQNGLKWPLFLTPFLSLFSKTYFSNLANRETQKSPKISTCQFLRVLEWGVKNRWKWRISETPFLTPFWPHFGSEKQAKKWKNRPEIAWRRKVTSWKSPVPETCFYPVFDQKVAKSGVFSRLFLRDFDLIFDPLFEEVFAYEVAWGGRSRRPFLRRK